MPADLLQTVRVWDLPTRVFHWALAVLVLTLFITGKLGGAAMVWHGRAGYAVTALLLTRLAWGFVGGRWSRFSAFACSPRQVVNYLRERSVIRSSVGHSPLGALSVYAMLTFLVLQAASGLFSDDRADFAGPLSVLVSNAKVVLLTAYHKRIGEPALIGLVVLHMVSVAYYQCGGRDLIKPMLHGDKELDVATVPSRDDAWSRLAALAVLALCAGFVAWLVQVGS